MEIWELKEINLNSQHCVNEAKILLQLYIAAEGAQITNVEQVMTAHLWACPCGSLANTEHRLVLCTIQPTNCEPGAADPSHHGYVVVSEEKKRIHEESIRKWCKETERKRKTSKKTLDTCSNFRCALNPLRLILFQHLQRCTTWLWGSPEASFPECELDHTDSPQTDWLMGYLSQPVKTSTWRKKNPDQINV